MIPLGKIRRVGDDHVEAAGERGQGAEEIPGEKPHARCQPESAHVVRGHGQRAQRLVHREHLQIRARGRESAGDGPAARADVGHERPGPVGEQLERALHEAFGFGTRNQDVGRHRDPETPELLEAQDVLDGLVRRAAVEQSPEAGGRARVDGTARLDVDA